METVAFCEIDPYCRAVLKKHWPKVPIYEDIKSLEGTEHAADLVCGGYPCQPFSQAGERRGAEDDRNLWPEMFRIIKAQRPAWVLCENVVGHVSMGLDDVLSDLEGKDYAVQTFNIPACAVDAPHRRQRVWIVGHTERSGEWGRRVPRCVENTKKMGRGPSDQSSGTSQNVANAGSQQHESGCDAFERAPAEKLSVADAAQSNDRRGISEARNGQIQKPRDGFIARNVADAGKRPQNKGIAQSSERAIPRTNEKSWRQWPLEPAICRVAYGIPNRVHRLRALGNAVVPQVVEEIGRAIMIAEESADKAE